MRNARYLILLFIPALLVAAFASRFVQIHVEASGHGAKPAKVEKAKPKANDPTHKTWTLKL